MRYHFQLSWLFKWLALYASLLDKLLPAQLVCHYSLGDEAQDLASGPRPQCHARPFESCPEYIKPVLIPVERCAAPNPRHCCASKMAMLVKLP